MESAASRLGHRRDQINVGLVIFDAAKVGTQDDRALHIAVGLFSLCFQFFSPFILLGGFFFGLDISSIIQSTTARSLCDMAKPCATYEALPSPAISPGRRALARDWYQPVAIEI